MHVLAEEDPLRPGTPILYHYLDHPGDIFRLWNGLAFYGGLIFAGLTALLFSRFFKIPAAKVADIAGVCIPLGLIFGRLGCFMAGCCHGGPTALPWGVQFEDPASLARPLAVSLHPTQIYSALFALLLFALMMMLKRRWKQYDGQVFLSFCVLYSSGRFVIEFFRNDNRGEFFDGYLSSSQFVALPIVVLSLVLMVLANRKKTDPDSIDSNRVDSIRVDSGKE
jgi:phosphatidylglycerol:prolipoprotein diacylglycerol transferase